MACSTGWRRGGLREKQGIDRGRRPASPPQKRHVAARRVHAATAVRTCFAKSIPNGSLCQFSADLFQALKVWRGKMKIEHGLTLPSFGATVRTRCRRGATKFIATQCCGTNGRISKARRAGNQTSAQPVRAGGG
jgi:hypothetical protein